MIATYQYQALKYLVESLDRDCPLAGLVDGELDGVDSYELSDGTSVGIEVEGDEEEEIGWRFGLEGLSEGSTIGSSNGEGKFDATDSSVKDGEEEEEEILWSKGIELGKSTAFGIDGKDVVERNVVMAEGTSEPTWVVVGGADRLGVLTWEADGEKLLRAFACNIEGWWVKEASSTELGAGVVIWAREKGGVDG